MTICVVNTFCEEKNINSSCIHLGNDIYSYREIGALNAVLAKSFSKVHFRKNKIYVKLAINYYLRITLVNQQYRMDYYEGSLH